MERPVPSPAACMPSPSSAIASTTSPSCPDSVIEIVDPPCSRAFPKSSLKTSARDVARWPSSQTGSRDALTSFPATSPCTSIARNRSISSSSSTSSSRCSVEHLVHRGDREDPVDRVPQRLLRVDVRCPRLQPQERGHGLQVVLDPVVDLLGEHAAQRHPPVLERDRRLARDRLQQLPVVVGERRVPVDDELADRPPAPAQRQAHGMRARAALRPGDASVLEHDRPPRLRSSTRPSSARSPPATPRGRATRRRPRRCARGPRARARAAAPAHRASRARSTAPPGRRSSSGGRPRPG